MNFRILKGFTPFFLGWCLMASAGYTAEEPVTLEGLPDPVSLNGEWLFKLATDAETAGELSGFHGPDFDSSGFASIPVPSNWNLLGFENPHWVNGTASEGFYIYSFDVPEAARGLRTTLHFGGVWVSAEVWVNGVNLGQHDSGFTSFAFDVSNELKPGELNRLAVRVRQQIPNNLFKFDANDDWALAGIYRDVWMEFAPMHVSIATVEVETDFDHKFQDADLNLRVFLFCDENRGPDGPSPKVQLRARLMTLDGEPVTEGIQDATFSGSRNGVDVRFSVPVEHPLHWTAETPNLYKLQIDLEREGVVIHRWKDKIGFREVSTEGGIFRINGEVVKLRGVNRHDQHPDVGRATRREHWIEDIELMQAANINAVRMAHYPPARGFIRLCDEMGLYVLNEIPLGFGGERLDTPEFAEGMLLRIHETIQRDRNHPSVIVWDFGNEDPLTALHITGLRFIKGLDSTRPVLLPYRYEGDLPPEVDILAPHYWNAEDYDRLASNARRPVITTEYTHALGTRDFGEMEQRWEALTRHPAGAGGFIWLWADEGLRRPVDGRPVLDPMEDKDKYTREGGELVRESDAGDGYIYDAHGNYGSDGIVNADRSPQRDYWEVKAVYAPVKVMHDHLDYVPGQASVQVPIRNDYDFTNLDEVTLQWKLFQDQSVLDSGASVIPAKPHTTIALKVPLGAIGKCESTSVYYLHVEAWRNGRLIMRESVRLGHDEMELPEVPVLADAMEISKDLNRVEVTAGEVVYAFNPNTGEIAGIRVADMALAGPASFVPWRPSTYCERNRYDRRKEAHDWNTFMQGLEPTLLEWDVATNGITTRITSTCEYRQDQHNRVVVDYVYTIRLDGVMKVSFSADFELDVPELPEIGLEFDLPSEPERMAWLGNGPLDSVPGKTAATCFGWWVAPYGSTMADGTKSGLEWARLEYGSGHQVHLQGQKAVRLESGPDGQAKFRVLTDLGGAWTKNGPPENPEWHLDLSRERTYRGSFILIPSRTDAR